MAVNQKGRVFIKIFTRDLEGKDCDLLEIDITEGKINATGMCEAKKEKVEKMDDVVIRES